jgi:integrase
MYGKEVANMGVYKRQDSKEKWWLDFSVRGIRYREPGGQTKAQAVALLAKRKLEIYEGRHFPDKKRGDLTFGGLRDLWLAHAANKRSIADDTQRFGVIVAFFGAAGQITSILPADVVRFKRHLSSMPTRTKQPLAAATINRHLALLKSALRLATNNQYIHRNPMVGVSMLAEHNKRERLCSDAEYQTLVRTAYPKLRLAIIIANNTAMRLGEIATLNWSQIDVKERVIWLRHGTTKTGEGRHVPIVGEVLTELLALPRALNGCLFDVVPKTLSSGFARLCRKLNLKDLRFHDFRHTAATRLRRAGVDILTIAKITGHKDLASLQRYNTITVEDMRLAFQQIPSANIAKK